MKYINFKKALFCLIFLILFSSCNYKPLLNNDQLNRLKFKDIQTEGDKRIVQMVVNKLNTSRDQTGNLNLLINGKKKIDVSNKSTTGKILEYSLNLTYEIKVEDRKRREIIFSKVISKTRSYKASSNYSGTINSEKKIIENISSSVAKQIIRELSISLRDDI